MTPERYKRLTDWLEGHPALREGIILLNRWLPLVPFVCYPVLLVLLNLRWFTMLTIGRGGGALDFMQVIARAILVPGLAFGLGTILRARLNFPRPYEQPGFVPLVSKETHGNSCPSRHALSAAVLGIDLRKPQTKDRRVTCTRFIENICRFTIEVSSVECQFIVPESCFNTDIGGTGLFPFQCRIDISGHCGSLCIHTSEYIVHRLSKCVSGLIRVVTDIIVTQDTV